MLPSRIHRNSHLYWRDRVVATCNHTVQCKNYFFLMSRMYVYVCIELFIFQNWFFGQPFLLFILFLKQPKCTWTLYIHDINAIHLLIYLSDGNSTCYHWLINTSCYTGQRVNMHGNYYYYASALTCTASKWGYEVPYSGKLSREGSEHFVESRTEHIYRYTACSKVCGENYRWWFTNHEIHESFPPYSVQKQIHIHIHISLTS